MNISSYYMKIETIKFVNRKDLNLLDKKYKDYHVNLLCEEKSVLHKWKCVRISSACKDKKRIYILLSKKAESEPFERRRHKRYRIEEGVSINLNGLYAKSNLPLGEAIDISQTGIAISCKDLGFVVGQELEIGFYKIKKPLKAKIVRKVDKQFTDRTTLGLQFKRCLYQWFAVKKIIKRR